MATELLGKVAIVTGASRGIGRAAALALAEAGADIVAAARSVGDLEETAALVRAKGRRALAVPTNVADEGSVAELVRRTLAEFGRVDILVNNAGTNVLAEVADLPLAGWNQTLSVNATGTFLCARAVVPTMRQQHAGRIINVVSGNGRQGQAAGSAYAASKHAVMGFSQSLAFEVRDDNVTVSCVLPGPTDTELRRAARPNEDRSLIMQPEDVAEVIVFLATRPDHIVISEVPVRPRVYMGGVA